MSNQQNTINRYNNYIDALMQGGNFTLSKDIVKDKERNVNNYIMYMLDRTQAMFEYDGLPDTIPAYMLELYLQTIGCCIITEVNGELYAMFGGWGGEPDAYYRPTKFIVANPYLKYFKTLTINEDCVICKNDTMLSGLLPLFNKYAWQLAENDLTIRITDINTRIVSLLTAEDDSAKEAYKIYMDKVIAGEYDIIIDQPIFNGIQVNPLANTANSNLISQLIELEQYLKASWYNDIGLNSNYNMKRESLNSAESQLNFDSLLPLVDNMLKCRQEFCDKVNEMYGTNITVKLNSAWELEANEVETATEAEAPETDDTTEVVENVETESEVVEETEVETTTETEAETETETDAETEVEVKGTVVELMEVAQSIIEDAIEEIEGDEDNEGNINEQSDTDK